MATVRHRGSTVTLSLHHHPSKLDQSTALRRAHAGLWSRLARARLILGASLAFVAGTVFRVDYALFHHHPRHHVGSDAYEFVALAELLLSDTARGQTRVHTIWPPGTASLLASGLLLDPTLGLTAVLYCLMSCTLPLLTMAIARIVSGPRAGWIALLFSSLHLGFVHYAGFFLSELPFMFWTTVAVLLSLLALAPGLGRAPALLRGVTAGLTWGLASAFRPNALPVAILLILVLAYRALRQGRHERQAADTRALVAGCLGLAAGLLVVVAPLAHRCTTLAGSFCPVSINTAMNMALGHAGEVKGVAFASPELGEPGPTRWYPPALLHHGFSETGRVPASIYDTPGIAAWLLERFMSRPLHFLLASVGNVFDLFRLEYWPDNYGGLQLRWATIAKQAFHLLVLAPALVVGSVQLRRLWRGTSSHQAATVLFVVLGMLLIAAATLGEARYRIPFDACWILMAAHGYARGIRAPLEYRAEDRGAGGVTHFRRVRVLAWSAVLFIASATALLVVGSTHPALRWLGQSVRSSPIGHAPTANAVARGDLAQSVSGGAAWDAPGHQVIRCRPSCPDLVVTLGESSRARRIALSVDHNDAYRVSYLNRGRLLADHVLLPKRAAGGVARHMIATPAAARADGFDSIAVRPLYGDGRYSIAALKLHD